jgi:hypothetical protein
LICTATSTIAEIRLMAVSGAKQLQSEDDQRGYVVKVRLLQAKV